MTSAQTTESELAWEGFSYIVVAAAMAGFWGGWLLMLLVGFVGHQTGDPRWFLGYWTCVPVALAVRALWSCLTRSTRRYARPARPATRR